MRVWLDEYSTNNYWSPWQIDWHSSHKIACGEEGRGRGRGGGPNQKRTWGGLHWQIWLGGGVLVQKKSPDLRSPEVGISDDIICLNTICPLFCKYNSYFIIISFFNNVLPQLQVLHETALIEAFNLKAGIEHQLKNCKLLVIFTGSLKILSSQKWAVWGWKLILKWFTLQIFCGLFE